MKWYGNLDNRLMEGKTVPEIKEGMDITMYYWSDRTCYYVTKVVDQKHIFVKEYEVVADRDKEGGMGHQNWCYFKTKKECNDYLLKYGLGKQLNNIIEDEPEEWVFRYNKWKRVARKDGWTGEPLEKPKYYDLSGKVSFGVRDYYYDWSF